MGPFYCCALEALLSVGNNSDCQETYEWAMQMRISILSTIGIEEI